MPHRLDYDLLRSFVSIADAGNLSRAAERLNLSQPTVSLHLSRLEQALGCKLIERGPRNFRLTGEGEMLLGYSRRLLALTEEAVGRLTELDVEGTVRLGAPEDFATTHLPGVLATFVRTHPKIALEVTTDLTLHLIDRFQAGEFDLVLVKREPVGPSDGVKVWREPLVWTCAADQAARFADRSQQLPLVVSPHPCVYRKRAQRALDAAGRSWRVAYTSTSLAGARAAVQAGLGISVLPKGMVPPDFKKLSEDDGLPPLPDTEIALMLASSVERPVRKFAEYMTQSLEKHS